jgi:hypothetical protein
VKKRLSDLAAPAVEQKNISIYIDSVLHEEIRVAMRKAGFKSWKSFVESAGRLLIEEQGQPVKKS